MQIQPSLGYFRAIFRLYQPPVPLLDLGPSFLHLLDPPLHLFGYVSYLIAQSTPLFQNRSKGESSQAASYMMYMMEVKHVSLIYRAMSRGR